MLLSLLGIFCEWYGWSVPISGFTFIYIDRDREREEGTKFVLFPLIYGIINHSSKYFPWVFSFANF